MSINYDTKTALETVAAGDMPADVLAAAEYLGWADPIGGLVAAAVMEVMDQQGDDILFETAAAAEVISRELGLSPEAKQFVLSNMGRARSREDLQDLTVRGFPKMRFGRRVYSNLWGTDTARAARTAGTFGGVIRMGKRSARGAAGK